MPTISFEADTQDELIAMVRRWVTGLAVEVPAAPEGTADKRDREVREVMRRITGITSRNLVLAIARAARNGDAVTLDQLRSLAGSASGASLGGALGGPNKLSRRIAGRDLITRDPVTGDCRIDPRDAEVILAAEG